MSTKTTNLQLIKADIDDFYDVNVQNDNMDKIDEEITKHTEDKNNPHGVTKSQVGLGNVPNVTTNDQTPTYTPATGNTSLSSGEKLSVAFGKIAKAINSLISHISDTTSHITSAERTTWNAKVDSSGTVSKATSDASGNNIVNTYATKTSLTSHTNNTNNPHSVTAAQVGAVPASETSSFNFTNKSLNTINIDEISNYNYVTALSEDGHGTRPWDGWCNVMNLWSQHFVTQVAFTCVSSTTPKRDVKMWIRERYMTNATGWSEWKLIHNSTTITTGTTDLTAGTSSLATGTIYLVYE